ncbi:hypothetical protein ACHAP5_002790 [Fusarium lateritium]
MEPAVLFITLLAMAFVLSANTPFETPRQAAAGALAAEVFAFLGGKIGASFLAQILSSTVGRLWKQETPLEYYMDHQSREFYLSGAKFDTCDRFYHKYGVCCNERGNCESCVKQQAEHVRKFAGMGQDEFDRRMKEALTE